MDRAEVLAYARSYRAQWLASPGRRLRQAPGLTGDRYVQPRDRILPVLNGHRAPEVPFTVVDYQTLPRAARTLSGLAGRWGWTVWLTYAKGWTLGSKRSPSRLAESYAVRLRKGDIRAVVVWGDQSLTCRYVLDPTIRAVSDVELKMIIQTGTG